MSNEMFAYMELFDDDELPDGAWFALMEEAAGAFTENTHSAVIAYVERDEEENTDDRNT